MRDNMNIPTAAELQRRREERANFTTSKKNIKKAMIKRSKGPYYLEQGYHSNDIFVKSDSGQGLFRFGNRDNWDEIDEGNATFIVNAMNAFDPLVEIAEQYKKSLQSNLINVLNHIEAKQYRNKIKQINEALKIAHNRVQIHTR